jgi:serine/threonine protein kinase
LLSGEPPWGDFRPEDSIRRARFDFDSILWNHVSDLGKDFIRRLIVADPAARMTADQALEDLWIAKYFIGHNKPRLVTETKNALGLAPLVVEANNLEADEVIML